MGLDMYLYKKHYVGNKYRKPAQRVKVVVPKDQEGVTFPVKAKIKTERISEISELVAQWRKANAIHQWFVENVQHGEDDCENYSVDRAELETLLDTCKKVLDASKLVEGKIQNGTEWTKDGGEKPIMVDGKYIEDATIAHKLLPTTEGFFFGSTDYDEYYLEDIQYTYDTLKALLAEDTGYVEYEYHSSW